MTKRVALVTGCGKASGIGCAVARALSAAGASVVVTDIAASGVANESDGETDITGKAWRGLESLVEELQGQGREAALAVGDVNSEADAKRMVQETLDRHGRLDILVNNAGAPHGADRNDIESVPIEAWDQVMGINARGTFLMTRAAIAPGQ